MEDSNKEEDANKNINAANNRISKHMTLSDNFIAFQSLNISHLLPNDPTPGDVQDLYVEENEQIPQQGNSDI